MMTVERFEKRYKKLKHYQTGVHWSVDENGNITDYYRYCRICGRKCKTTYGISYEYDGKEENGAGRVEACGRCYKKRIKPVVETMENTFFPERCNNKE